MRLIDVDRLIKRYIAEKFTGYEEIIQDILDEPTVEAIPKADYDNRLKSDLKAILVELQLEIKELEEEADIGKVVMIGTIDRLIQQKIDEYKAETEET